MRFMHLNGMMDMVIVYNSRERKGRLVYLLML
jgi:hypothetical protein